MSPAPEGRQRAIIGARLAFLVWLFEKGSALPALVEQEQDLWRRELNAQQSRFQRLLGRVAVAPAPHIPSPLTAAVRLRPAEDRVLNLSFESIRRIDPTGRAIFDPARPAVAVSIEFLGSRSDLLPLGVIPAAQAGDVFFGWVNLHSVSALAKNPAVLRIDALRTWTPAAGGSISAGNTTSGGGGGSETGAGVRLAVIDLGFDFLHPAFLQPIGASEEVRTLWLHDFALAPAASAPAGSIGRRFTGSDLQNALLWYEASSSSPKPEVIATHIQRLKDALGNPEYRTLVQQHGTGTAGIAAGNGHSSSPLPSGPAPVPGVAPDADLLFLAIGGHDEKRFADSLDVHSAFAAAFEGQTAACVALMANSDNLGPHDGTLGGEEALDDLLLLPGRAIVLSAGNLNHTPGAPPTFPAWHAAALIGSGAAPPLPLVLRFDSGASWPDCAEIWFRPPANTAASATIAIKIRNNPVGQPIPVSITAQPVTILTPADNPLDGTTVVAQLGWYQEADAYCLSLIFQPAPSREIVRSEWSITVPADGPVHGWLDRNNEGAGRWTGPTAQAGANATTLGSPAVAIRPLTVGSIQSAQGTPSSFSGRGPIRATLNAPHKPDLVAIGEGVVGPRGVPADRWNHLPSSGPYRTFDPPGTSYSAPQVAGACALLFERFGAAATWADIRQAILQAAVRTSNMPMAGSDGWDNACGYGMLDLNLLKSPPMPVMADLWLPKAEEDTGAEPFVAPVFWNSPALALEDAQGRALDATHVAVGEAIPARLRVKVKNRGAQPARNPDISVWWAPLGAVHPLPQSREGGGAWQADGFSVEDRNTNSQRVTDLDPGQSMDVIFNWIPPRDTEGRVIPHVLIATVGNEVDPFDPDDTLCAQNNAAALDIAAARSGTFATFNIIGSRDIDGVTIRSEAPEGRILIEEMPISALPWRDSQMFAEAGRSERPLYGSDDEVGDMAATLEASLEGQENIQTVTEALGVESLKLANGLATIEGRGSVTLRRLRIAPGARLALKVAVEHEMGDALHMLHLSGGRRVGGGTVRILG
ncbi:S8 family serine peptidase [Microvirga massiliensis]|uniref:S8 family serine peptidase n=1 Tax=Microvirga massiliensis TaxID=1033741 RepID=UPI00062B8B8D|nr:S8 family serine peptidase [Microvirga massiliensis]